MVPFQSDIMMSDELARPKLQASAHQGQQARVAGWREARTGVPWIARRTGSQALLALLQLLQETEVSGDFGTHVGGLRENDPTEVGCAGNVTTGRETSLGRGNGCNRRRGRAGANGSLGRAQSGRTAMPTKIEGLSKLCM